MEVYLVERHYGSTKDGEGEIDNERKMDTESKEFEKYLGDFHVLEKYRKGQKSRFRSWVLLGEREAYAGDAFFSGWAHTDTKLKRVMCYIEVIYPVH